MKWSDWTALALSLLAVLVTYQVADRYFDQIPHLEDEIAYIWQARLMADGSAAMPSPIEPKRFLVPFVVDYEGQRFGKYPLGWPALLSLGIRFGIRSWVNPLLAGLAVWLTYRLGQKLRGDLTGLLASVLTLTSPFFLVNGASLLSHMMALVLALGFVLAWWDVAAPPKLERTWQILPVITAGTALGLFAATRPFTALGVAIPFGIHGLVLLFRGDRETRMRVLSVGFIALLLSLLQPLWQLAAAGAATTNLYTLWWPYDKVGFGPGVGVTQQGHTLRWAWLNTRFSLLIGSSDLFGWPMISWIFIPLGLWFSRRDTRTLLTGSVFFSLLLLYQAYWISAWLFGPRYQFEGLFSLTILSAIGIAGLAGWSRSEESKEQVPITRNKKLRALGTTAFVTFFIVINLIFYMPPRFSIMKDLYGISKDQLAPFERPTTQALAPAVLVVYAEHWTHYGGLLELVNPALTSPFIFTFGDKPGLKETLKETYPERAIYYYYPDEPWKFYVSPRP